MIAEPLGGLVAALPGWQGLAAHPAARTAYRAATGRAAGHTLHAEGPGGQALRRDATPR